MNKKRISGFTLLEVVLTVVISSILFLSVGLLFIQTQQGWFKAQKRAAMTDDFRYCRTRFEYVVRSAQGPITLTNANKTLQVFDASANAIQFTYDSNAHTLTYVKGATTEILLGNIDSLTFTLSGASNGTIELQITRTPPPPAAQQKYDVTVRCRNVN